LFWVFDHFDLLSVEFYGHKGHLGYGWTNEPGRVIFELIIFLFLGQYDLVVVLPQVEARLGKVLKGELIWIRQSLSHNEGGLSQEDWIAHVQLLKHSCEAVHDPYVGIRVFQ